VTAPLVWHSARTPMTEHEVHLNCEARHGNSSHGPRPAAMDADRQAQLQRIAGMGHMRADGQLWERLAAEERRLS
jgi:hypothetical protein